GQRPLLQPRIGLPRRPAELTLDDLRDLGIRDGSGGGTQVLELLGVLDGQQVPTGGEHLAELDERRTELLEGAAQAGGAIGCARGRQPTAHHLGRVVAQSDLGGESRQSIADQHLCDPAVARGVRGHGRMVVRRARRCRPHRPARSARGRAERPAWEGRAPGSGLERTALVREAGQTVAMSDVTKRALRLLALLQSRSVWTGPELAAEMDVTTRT